MMLARLIRRLHPKAHIVVGGPHVTALPFETLRHEPAVDTVVMGEGEETFMEIVQRLEQGEKTAGLAGTAWRDHGTFQRGPPRAFIAGLDTLASPVDYFTTQTLLTSRGCPMNCTFCGSAMMWGHRVRYHSAEYVLDRLDTAVNRRHLKIIAIKDDTFTSDKNRVLAICEGIQKRGLHFIWSCDTRCDFLDEEILRAMRLAGCARISLGVESASRQILKNIRKKISVEKLLDVTESIKKFGIHVRYYMMVGNRGETWDTYQESLRFIEKAKPNQYVFSQLHLYPGTEEFAIFEQNGAASPELFFLKNFVCLTCFAGSKADEQKIRDHLAASTGKESFRPAGVAECRASLSQLPDCALQHMDLCRALFKAGDLVSARHHLEVAVRLGYCLPGLIQNVSACFLAARGDLHGAKSLLDSALRYYPHRVVMENINTLDEHLALGGIHDYSPLKLNPGEGFEAHRLRRHPEYPI
jgi:anaerobic magnesium-protoporphyrin IX monomethyl ester cyclase